MTKTPAGGTSTDEDITDVLGLKEGSIVEGTSTTYLISKVLGEGGFGAVFKVKNQKTNESFAMKVEPRAARKHNKLKMEIDILKRLSKEREKSHFAKIVDRGKNGDQFVYIVMDLLGPSLADIKDRCAKRILPISTGLGVSLQCFEALEDLHKHKFIHRDLKPANYARGRGNNRHVIYLFDFGIARKMSNDKGEIKTPRGTVNFKGTVRFASIRCHSNQDISYPDDCESWFYLMLDLIAEGGLPWKHMNEKDEVMMEKKALQGKKSHLIAPKLACRSELLEILKYLAALEYYEPVDYTFVRKCMQKAALMEKVDLGGMYFWEDKKTTKSNEKC